MPKSYIELEKQNKLHEAAMYVFLSFILVIFFFIAIINDKIEADFTAYEDKISKLEAKNKVLRDELSDIEMSGMCLKRISAYER